MSDIWYRAQADLPPYETPDGYLWDPWSGELLNPVHGCSQYPDDWPFDRVLREEMQRQTEAELAEDIKQWLRELQHCDEST